MRVLLAGSPPLRARMRERLAHVPIEVVGEFATVAAARASGVAADGILVAPGADEDRAAADEPLTPREAEVLDLLAEGLANKAIAAHLGISDQTVKFHVASVIAKLGARNRTDAVRRAVRRGLITL